VEKLFGFDPSLIGGFWYGLFMDLSFAVVFLIGHFSRKLRLLPLYLVISVMSVMAIYPISMIALELVNSKVHLLEILVYAFSFGTFIFIATSEWLMRGGANRLTEKRGDKWPKEIDYLYLSLGACGIAISIARLPSAAENVAVPHLLGMLLLVTALVFRLIKTRAEVNEWNKAGRNNDPTGDAVITASPQSDRG
jgi:hypothetical protein